MRWLNAKIAGLAVLKFYWITNQRLAACLETTIGYLNLFREEYLKTKDKDIWWQMIQLLPSSYNQTRNVMLNYEVLANIYRQRKNHKLDEWREFCKWIESLPYKELITGLPIGSDQSIVEKRLAEDDPMIFSVGKVVHDLIAKELDGDIKKQILEEDSK